MTLATSEAIDQIGAALAAAQAVVKPVLKNKLNPHFKNRYADLSGVWDSCREPLSSNGIAVIQVPSFHEGRLLLITRLIHKSGQWIQGALSIRPDKDTAQGIGACVTYARRYMLAAMVGVIDEDDDDGESSNRKEGDKDLNQAKVRPGPSKNAAPATTPANTTTESAVFHAQDLEALEHLEKWLMKLGIQADKHLGIAASMNGKPFTKENLQLAINVALKE